MEQPEKAGFGRMHYLMGAVAVCVALLLGATAYYGAGSAKGTAGNLSAALNSTGPQPIMPALNATEEANDAANASGQQAGNASGKEVTVDFLYSDGCGHCLNMKPRVSGVAASLPEGRLEVRYWNYAEQDGATREIYALYGRLGHFRGGVPTFVINGNDSRVGEMAEQDFREWVCSKFSLPKPAGC